MSDYATGHVKRDPASGSVAVRTHFPDNADFVSMTWLVSHVAHGPQNVATSAVEGWDDLFVPQANG